MINLENWYDAGTVSVASGGTTVTVVGGYWGDDAIMAGDLFCDPAQPLVPPQRVKEVTGDTTLELWAPWPGSAMTADPYEIRYIGIIERSTAQSRRVLEQLGDVKAWADIFVQTDADRLALDTPTNPLTAKQRVLVVNDGVIWQKKTSAYNDWLGPAAFKGDTGNKGWSPVFSVASDGERRVWQLSSWVGGQGTAPAGVGKYVGATGLVDNIADGVNVRGPAGNISGVTAFWQSRITNDADASSARIGLGASAATFIDGLVPFNSPSNPTSRVGVSAGAARDRNNQIDLVLASAIEKRIDQVWAAGSGNGGRDAATPPAAGSSWHIHLIRNPGTGAVDILFSQSATAPTLPSGFTQRRRLGAFMLNSSSQPYPGLWYANGEFAFKPSLPNAGNVAIGGPALVTLFVPQGVKVKATYRMTLTNSETGNPAFGFFFSDPDLGAPSTAAELIAFKNAGENPFITATSWTDTAGRVYRGSLDAVAGARVGASYVIGWVDLRDG